MERTAASSSNCETNEAPLIKDDSAKVPFLLTVIYIAKKGQFSVNKGLGGVATESKAPP